MNLNDRMNPQQPKPDYKMIMLEGEGDSGKLLNKVAGVVQDNYKLSTTGKKANVVLVVAVSTGTFDIGAALEPCFPAKFVEDFGFALKEVCYKHWRKKPKDPNPENPEET